MKRLAALAALKLSLFLKPRMDEEFFETYSRILAKDVTEEELAGYPELPEELFYDRPELAERYEKIFDICSGDPIALCAVQLYMLTRIEERAEAVMREGMGTADGLTIETAARITFRDKETVEIMPQLRRAFSLVEILLRAETGRDYVKAQFARDARLAAWLGGDDAPDAFLDCEVYASEQLPEPVLTRGLIDRVVSCLGRAREFAVVHISGEIGSGRRTFARHCAKVLGRELLMVPFSAVGEDGVLNLPMWRRVLRELLLTDRLLCLCDVKCAPEKRTARLPAMLARMQKDLAQFESPVFITSEKDIKISPFMGVPVCTVAVPAPTIPQSAQLWRDIVGECAAEGGKKNVQITLRCGLRRVRLWQGERLLWLYWVKRMPFWKAVYHLQLYQDGRNEKL